MLGVSCYLIGQELERDKTVETDVFGLVDHTHPSTTEFLDNPVVRDSLANHQGLNHTWAKLAKSMKPLELACRQTIVVAKSRLHSQPGPGGGSE